MSGKKESLDELGTARKIATGELPSPQRLENMSLYAMRMSGTGASYRRGIDEFVWRKPDIYLSQEMVDRCAGVPVIWEHPDTSTLDSKEFAKRVVGTTMLGYVKDDELWCVARIYDEPTIKALDKGQLSTSPAVVFGVPSVNEKIALKDGSTLLIEGKPSLLDHLAICERGVWDKGSEPYGVDAGRKDSTMSDEQKAAAADQARKDEEKKAAADDAARQDADKKLDAVLAALDSIGKRMDAYDEKDKADAEAKKKADAEAKEKADAEAKEKADSEAKEKADSEAKEKADEDDKKKEKEECEEGKEKGDPEKLAADKSKKDEDDKKEKEKMDAAEKARKDADELSKRVADIENAVRMSDSEADELAIAQTKADAVYSSFGRKALRPMYNERALAYRRRIAKDLQTYSPKWKDANLDRTAEDSVTFTNAEVEIYADSQAAAQAPASAEDMSIREIVKIDPTTGRRIHEFVGQPLGWMSQFMPARSVVTKFNVGQKD